MDHQDARALMAAAVEGGLASDSERELAVHLVGCAECKALYRGLQQAETALRALRFAHPPPRAIEAAIRRATTVLRGEADPGPDSLAPGVPKSMRLPIGEEVDFDSAPVPLLADASDDIVPAAVPLEPESPKAPDAPVVAGPDPELSSRPVTVQDAAAPPVTLQATGEPPTLAPELPSVFTDLAEAHDVKEVPQEEQTDEDIVLPPLPPVPGEHFERVAALRDAEPIGTEAADVDPYIAELEHRRPPPEQLPRPRATGQRRRPGAARWLAAITATVLLAAVAGFVITRSQTGGGSLPSAAEVRSRVERAFTQMRSLKASFVIRRLDLYPVGRQGTSMQYSFAVGTSTGRLVYERTAGYREETTTDVNGTEIATTKAARTTAESRTLQGSGGAAKLVVVRNPPLGPPDGDFRPSLGSLDRAVGSVAHLLTGASDLEVLGLKKAADRQLVDVRFGVVPTEVSRADKIEVLLDARTYVPVHIRREIGSGSGRVLAPESVLQASALQTAFGNRDRILSEDVDITDLVVDDVILPGDFVLDVPQGVPAQTRDGQFQRVTRPDLASKLHFAPLFPSPAPAGFSEQALAVFTGKPGAWGPNNSYPAPDGILQASYFDGTTTIVITQRHMPKGPFDIHGSPVVGGTLPMQTTSQVRAEKTFFYSWSPEVTPHAYGFLGDVFVMVTGNASADDLIGFVSSLQQSAGAPNVTASGPAGPTATP